MTDWQQKVEDILHTIPGYNPWDQRGDSWLDHLAALNAINWFGDHLKHVEGSARGEPFILRKWQAAIVGNLFGWQRKDDAGRIVRRYRRALIYVPRGNGKTPLAGGIVLYAFLEDGEPGAQCFLAAGQKEQAGFLFRNASGMVDQDPDLSDRVKIFRGDQHRHMTLLDDPLSFCKTIPADAAGQHGGIPHITVIDELHAQESRDLVDVFETGMSKKVRAQPLLVMITTADYDRESICNEVHAHACRVRDNGGDPEKPGFDPTFLPVIYEAGPDDDWSSEDTWRKANPNWGVSVDAAGLRASHRKATEVPAFENAFRRLHLNQKTGQDVSIIPMRHWDECPRELPEGISLAGRACYAGMDLASTEDLASLALVFPLPADLVAVLSFSWCPEAKIERRKAMKFPYDVWHRNGHLFATAGDQIDYREIRRYLNEELKPKYDIREIGYDPHGAAQLAQDLRDHDGFEVVLMSQSFRTLAGPTKELIRLVKLHRLIHFGNPVLRWAASNAAAHFEGRIPAGQKIEDHLDKVPVMLSKRKSADKIDPAAALVLGLASKSAHPNLEETSVWDGKLEFI